MKVQGIIQAIESIAPKHLAFYPEDNNGLLVGSYSAEVNKVLLALDLTYEVLEEAISLGCNMIITHHPFIFKGIKNIREDNVHGKIISKAIREKINIYSAHTNLDVAHCGVNEALRKKLDLPQGVILQRTLKEDFYKIVVYAPWENKDEILMAMSKAGAGQMGKYSHCSFISEGEGTFMPLDGSNPYLGKVGHVAKVKEIKIETIANQRKLDSIIKAMKKVHPYEEVAYDVWPLKNSQDDIGLGKIIQLPETITAKELALYVKERLGCQGVKVFGNGESKISKVAICGGSGSSLIHTAKYSGCNCLITGDIDYHEGQMALELGITIIDAGHYHTEVPILKDLQTLLKNCIDEVEVIVTQINTCPYEIL